MSDIKQDGFKVRSSPLCMLLTPFTDRPQASETLAALAKVFEGFSDEEKKAQIKKARTTTLYPLFRSHDHDCRRTASSSCA